VILIGGYGSPFARRIAITLCHYGIPFTHSGMSTQNDRAEIAKLNPLVRVPTLVLDDGEVLTDSFAIVDHLDQVVGEARALMPRSGAQRRAVLRITALAAGMADKSVALYYEHAMHDVPSAAWSERCRRQVEDTLAALEAERAQGGDAFWFGPALSHADIALACGVRFTRRAHAGLFDETRYPALAAHAARCEALEAFRQCAPPPPQPAR